MVKYSSAKLFNALPLSIRKAVSLSLFEEEVRVFLGLNNKCDWFFYSENVLISSCLSLAYLFYLTNLYTL